MVPRRAAGWWSETTRSSVNDDTENKNTMADINTIAEELGKLTVLEASELVKKLEEDWGVSAAAPAAAVAVAAPAEAEAAEAVEGGWKRAKGERGRVLMSLV